MTSLAGILARGLTLVEALLASVVLAVVATAVIMPFTASAQFAAVDARQTLAVNLAQDVMEEVLARPFSDPDGTEAGETTRWSWDDKPDYHGYVEGEGTIRSFDGTAVTEPAAVGLSRSVTVEGVYVSGQDTGCPPSFLRITVRVFYHGDTILELCRLAYANE